jgi:hypothetical protein
MKNIALQVGYIFIHIIVNYFVQFLIELSIAYVFIFIKGRLTSLDGFFFPSLTSTILLGLMVGMGAIAGWGLLYFYDKLKPNKNIKLIATLLFTTFFFYRLIYLFILTADTQTIVSFIISYLIVIFISISVNNTSDNPVGI